MDINSILSKSKQLDEEYFAARNELYAEASKELDATVLGIDGRSIHIYEAEWVACISGAVITKRNDEYYPWQIDANTDEVHYFSLMRDELKKELEGRLI